MSSAYLSINLTNFEKVKKEGIETAKLNELTNFASFETCELATDDIEFTSDEELLISGALRYNNNEIAQISITVELPTAIVGDILESYVKKINRIKTILEAAK